MKKLLFVLAIFFSFMLSVAISEEQPIVYSSGDFKYILLEDGTVEIVDFTSYNLDRLTLEEISSKRMKLQIPSRLDGYVVTSIGKQAFYDCWHLTSIFIPDSVKNIEANPFLCGWLEAVTVSPNNEYFTTIDGVLFEKSKKRLVCYLDTHQSSEYIVPYGVLSIGEKAFNSCESLVTVTIPDSVISIDNNAFGGCSSLSSVTIPDSVTTIGDYAFSYCESLTSVTIPDSVSSMGINPFRSCSKLTNIKVSPKSKYFATIDGVLFEKSTKKLVCYPCAFTAENYVIPQGILAIGDYAFYFCSSLASVTIPDSVTSIGDSAFFCCRSITSVTIPDSVIYIGREAFYLCESLISVTIGNKDVFVGDGAFQGCFSLTLMTIADTITSGGYEFILIDSDTVRIISANSAISKKPFGTVQIPSRINNYIVTEIGDEVFLNSRLSAIIIPDGVTSIGNRTFFNAKSMESIIIPGSVIFIGEDAISNSEKLILTVEAGSYAEEWAIENQFKYIYSSVND